MAWRKLGCIFKSEGQRDWMMTHATCPQAEHLEGDRFRIWFSPRDKHNRTYTGWIEIDLNKPAEILRLAEKPASWPGGLGEFDENGSMFSCHLKHQDKQYIFYTGWNRCESVPFRNAIGVMTAPLNSFDFVRPYQGPLLDRCPFNPLYVSNPWVVVHEGMWWVWYIRGINWYSNGEKIITDYNIASAKSCDGVHWDVIEEICIDHAHPGEMAIARPCVRVKNGLFEMWYSFRGKNFSYRLGYATSKDGVHWQRSDETIDVPRSPEGWDSEMIAYPYVFEHKGKTYLLYAGNGYSQGGIGLAVHGS